MIMTGGNPYTDCITPEGAYGSSYIQQPNFQMRVAESIDTFSLGIMFVQLMTAFTGFAFNIGSCNLNPDIPFYKELKTIHEFINLMIVSNSLNRLRPDQIYTHFLTNVLPVISKKKSSIIKSPKILPLKTSIIGSVLDAAPDIESIIASNCPPNKIFNRKTMRCVLKSGVLGKKLLKTQKLSFHTPICPTGKILNRRTMRCIKATGALAKKIAQAKKRSGKKIASAKNSIGKK